MKREGPDEKEINKHNISDRGQKGNERSSAESTDSEEASTRSINAASISQNQERAIFGTLF